MTIEYIWNNGTIEQRTGLLKAIYGESCIMFHRDISKNYKDIPYGVQLALADLKAQLKTRQK